MTISVLVNIKKLLSACGLPLRSNYKNLNYLTKSSSMSDENYENAINCLNKLQSNATTIKKSIIDSKKPNNSTHDHSNKFTKTIKYLNRTGLTLNDLDKLSIIHVTGTKGKGSTCSLTESILRQYNLKTGFFSSPHLVSVTERFRINGIPIDREEFTKKFWKIYNYLKLQQDNEHDMPPYFQFLTILCFHIFIDTKVDVLLLEVGIGGEYDSTNIIRNTKTVAITSLALEHTNLLGNTIEEIAWQKAGIIKNNSNCFTVSPQPLTALNVIKERSIEKNANLCIVPNFNEYNWYRIPKLQINHEAQMLNASLAIQLAYDWLKHNKYENDDDINKNISLNEKIMLNVPEKFIDGLENSFWPGRCQLVDFDNYKIYLDGAHTIESIQLCVNWFNKSTHDNKNIKILIFNATGNRDVEKLLKIINDNMKFNNVYFVPNIAYEKGIRDTSDSKTVTTHSDQFLKCIQNLSIWNELNNNSNNINDNNNNSNDNNNNGECITNIENVFKSIDQKFDRNNNIDILVTGSIHLIGATILALEQFEETRSNIIHDNIK